MEFKKGSEYSRHDIHNLYFGCPYPPGGRWTSGFVNPKGTNDLIIFMNIDVPGKTGHNYPNKYDPKEKKIIWYGDTESHSEQPTFKKVLNYEFTSHFFARWDKKNKYFLYLGVGKNFSFKDKQPTTNNKGEPTTSIEITLSVDDSDQILSTDKNKLDSDNSFVMEKHLEEFIIGNWDSLDLGREYDICEETIDGKRKKFRTDTGEIDIFAISKDKKTYLVIELKKGRASDKVVGQIQRYMGYIQDEIATSDQKVKGLIIGLNDDLGLRRALTFNSDIIQFKKYKIKFDLVEN